jgi:hypothetical protein
MRGNNKKRKADKEASVDHDDESNKNEQDESNDDAKNNKKDQEERGGVANDSKNDTEKSDDDTGHHHGDGNDEDAGSDDENAGSDDDSHSDSDDVSRGIEFPNNPTFDVAGILADQSPKETDEAQSVSDDVIDELTEMGSFKKDDAASLVLSDLIRKNPTFQKMYAKFTREKGGVKTDCEPAQQLSNDRAQKRK